MPRTEKLGGGPSKLVGRSSKAAPEEVTLVIFPAKKASDVQRNIFENHSDGSPIFLHASSIFPF